MPAWVVQGPRPGHVGPGRQGGSLHAGAGCRSELPRADGSSCSPAEAGLLENLLMPYCALGSEGLFRLVLVPAGRALLRPGWPSRESPAEPLGGPVGPYGRTSSTAKLCTAHLFLPLRPGPSPRSDCALLRGAGPSLWRLGEVAF